MSEFMRDVWNAYTDQAEASSDTSGVRDIDAWRTSVAATARRDLRWQATQLRDEVPDATPAQIAASLHLRGTPESLQRAVALEQVAEAGRRVADHAHAEHRAMLSEPEAWELGPQGVASARAQLPEKES